MTDVAPAQHPQTRDRSRAFGVAVAAHRARLGLSQEALAERIVDVARTRAPGVDTTFDRQSINRVEGGRFSPSLHRCLLIADGLGVPLAELVAEPTDTGGAG
jgi:transcriptional regulator with XRE-family HTH domain